MVSSGYSGKLPVVFLSLQSPHCIALRKWRDLQRSRSLTSPHCITLPLYIYM